MKYYYIIIKQHTKPCTNAHKNHCWFPEHGSRMHQLPAERSYSYRQAGAARLDGLPGCSPPWKM